jgi:hypothetical protein
METELNKMEHGQIVSELKKHFSSGELDEAKEEIDGFVAESETIEELTSKVRAYLDNPTFQE